ncbi:mono/diheme cytochrome c family protein [Nitrobacteraceae bacterium AZCC 1564]
MSGLPEFRLRAIGLTVAVGLAFGISGIAFAQEGKPGEAAVRANTSEAITSPSDPVAKAAFNVLEQHCARCHQQGKLVERERPAKNFGNILKLDEIASNPHYVLPGNPLGSKLFRQIADKEMPYDINYEGETRYPRVSEADIKALEDWISALGTKATATCEAHKFITPNDMIALMAKDLDKQLPQRRQTTRYLTLTHLANICADAAAMNVYRQAAVKFLNSLSRSSDVIKLETIDPERTIIRFNLADLGWNGSDWENVIATYPYMVDPDTETSRALATSTRAPMAYVRADWFAFVASQPPLYDVLLQLPNTFQQLAREQGIDIEGNIRNFVAQRAAFQKSGVSQNNRLIERHPSRSGYFWTSYDFAGNKDRQNLFDYPLGPSGQNTFHHDGGETIFSLPNGFQAYYLNKATGERLDKGPTAIVRDPSRKDFSVTNGISCMGCHDQGMRKAKDDVRDLILNGRTFPREVREQVEGLYPPHDKMDALIEGDGKRFADAMKRAGLDPALKLNGIEMINALAKRYEDDLDLTLAAAELGLTKTEFKEGGADVAKKYRPLLRRLSQGSVPRDAFELAFREIAPDMTDLKPVQMSGRPAVQPVARPVGGDIDLSLTSDQDSYRVGDSPVFTIVTSRDCFLTLMDIDEKGEGTVLMPNRFQQENFIKAGVPIQFPGAGAPFQFRMKDKGRETVTAVCATQAGGGDRIQHDFNKNQFTPVPNYTTAVARSIAVVPANSGAPAISGVTNTGAAAVSGRQPPPQGSRVSFRAAIQLQVR